MNLESHDSSSWVVCQFFADAEDVDSDVKSPNIEVRLIPVAVANGPSKRIESYYDIDIRVELLLPCDETFTIGEKPSSFSTDWATCGHRDAPDHGLEFRVECNNDGLVVRVREKETGEERAFAKFRVVCDRTAVDSLCLVSTTNGPWVVRNEISAGAPDPPEECGVCEVLDRDNSMCEDNYFVCPKCRKEWEKGR